jgi:hypothetical protein
MLDQLRNERNMVLYAWRRLGKTALIRHFFHHLEAEGLAECVFTDLMGTTSIEAANRRIATAILDRFGSLNRGISQKVLRLIGSLGATVGLDPLSGAPQLSFGVGSGQADVEQSFEVLGAYLTERKKLVVICIDEFQQVQQYGEDTAEAVFRSWTQAFPMIRFVFSGSHRQMMTSMFSESSRPFYKSAQVAELSVIDSVAYTAFIKSHFEENKKEIADSSIVSLLNWTRGQTYYVQLVCNKLYGDNRRDTSEYLDAVYEEIILQEAPIFSSMQQLFTTFQWQLLMAIAKEEMVRNPLAQEFSQQHRLGAASSVNSALQALIKKEFVVQEAEGYTLQDTLLLRWLQTLD